MKERIIPKKNYFILSILAVATIILTFYLSDYYFKREKEIIAHNTTMNFLLKITENDLKNYIADNHDVIIYFSNSYNKSLIDYEKKLKKTLVNSEMEQQVV